MRFFRCESGDAFYEGIRSTLDAAWGLPNDATKTATCIEPASTAIRDASGRILLAVHTEFCEFTVAVDLLPQMLLSGDVSEITRQEYDQAAPSPYG